MIRGMANPPRKKGTAYENKVLVQVRRIWPDADRAKAGNVSCDIVGTDLDAVECKHRQIWAVKEWVRNIRKVSPRGRWALFISDGDRRRADSAGEVVVFPADFAHELLDTWNDLQYGVLTIDTDYVESLR
jgi:hypothetical protein